ncbi:succinate dehydrogenase cytochrome b558 subunit [Blastopirellula retiformator]|uniref:Succinate dehydrogenase cytochrome b558 subunit n=1 Tax=Blastopirellula retiformator TaxID=2527970 RepID=A0A5C5V477_9BACT|nr:succinate dehydrogenase cytochrome b558 subunit [Blastopirellula retiformator]TWT32759.1 Succinate dehydrogenase cytochrome b558 subunit [Blastopirellula retiformator]
MSNKPGFWARNEFLIRRLHSLTGLVPVGAYMIVHLLVNASVAASPETFQRNVFSIHSLGALLPLVEWTFIFLPIMFHAFLGLAFTMGASPNYSEYRYNSNFRYTMQRATGLLAFVFIAWHVFHMHGWIHNEAWLHLIQGWGGMFKPYNAATSAAHAMQASVLYPILYTIGVLACVFHLSNGLFTMGITWGIWISPKAQTGAKCVTSIFGLALALVGITSIVGLWTLKDFKEIREKENTAYELLVEIGDIPPSEHKRDLPAEELDEAPAFNGPAPAEESED